MNEKIYSEAFQNLDSVAKENKNKFLNNTPFPHLVFDNFFNEAFLDSIENNFPDLEQELGTTEFDTKRDKKKFATDLNFVFPEKINFLLNILNSYKFLNFLQQLTGIKETLMPDPYFWGGGLHQMKKGGFLKVHSDFNYHPLSKLDRRINILIYLNKEWKNEYGGHLELWDKNMENCGKKISPIFNKMVVFNTNDFSYHGHPDPLNCPENMTRKSIALYYYSNGRPKEEINEKLRFHSTIYRNRKNTEENIEEKMPEFKKLFGKFYIRKKIKV